MQELAILLAAAIPAIITIIWFTGRDPDRASSSLIYEPFFVGACGGILVVGAVRLSGFEVDDSYPPVIAAVLEAFLQASIPEEIAKLAIVVVVSRRHLDRHFPHDLVVIGAAVAGGFATLENIAYIVGAERQLATALIRAQLSVPSHVFNGVMIGAGLALYEIGRRPLWFVPAIILPIATHGLFNFPLCLAPHASQVSGTFWAYFANGHIAAAVVVLSALVAYALSMHVLRLENRLQKRPEVDLKGRFASYFEKAEVWLWYVLSVVLAIAGLISTAAAYHLARGEVLFSSATLFLYAVGAGYQGRQLRRRRRSSSVTPEVPRQWNSA